MCRNCRIVERECVDCHAMFVSRHCQHRQLRCAECQLQHGRVMARERKQQRGRAPEPTTRQIWSNSHYRAQPGGYAPVPVER